MAEGLTPEQQEQFNKVVISFGEACKNVMTELAKSIEPLNRWASDNRKTLEEMQKYFFNDDKEPEKDEAWEQEFWDGNPVVEGTDDYGSVG